jgi:hypothetical protein
MTYDDGWVCKATACSSSIPFDNGLYTMATFSVDTTHSGSLRIYFKPSTDRSLAVQATAFFWVLDTCIVLVAILIERGLILRKRRDVAHNMPSRTRAGYVVEDPSQSLHDRDN